MASAELEGRVAALERELAKLKAEVRDKATPTPWWERIAGTFQDDPVYAKAMKLGRQYRRSLKSGTSQGKK
jgi:hypothetical protein